MFETCVLLVGWAQVRSPIRLNNVVVTVSLVPASGDRLHVPDPVGVRVLIVSGVRLYREGLVLALADRLGKETLTAAPQGALAALASFTPDVILMECATVLGTDLVRRLGEILPGARVVAFALPDDENEVVACAEVGIAGFVEKDASSDELVAVIEAAARGEVRCSSRVAALLVRRVSGQAAERRARPRETVLTATERKVLGLIDQDLSNKEIASRLGIEVSTVKNHLHHILSKIHVRRRGQAASWLRSNSGDGRAKVLDRI